MELGLFWILIMIKINLLKPHYEAKNFKRRGRLRGILTNLESISEGRDIDFEILGYVAILTFWLGILFGIILSKGI